MRGFARRPSAKLRSVAADNGSFPKKVRIRLFLPLLVLLVGCGQSAEEKAARDRQAERQAKARRAQAQLIQCREKLEPLQTELSDLASRVKVGMNYPAYTQAAGDVRVEYDRWTWGRSRGTAWAEPGCS